VLLSPALLLAQSGPSLVRQAFWLWVALATVGVVLITIVWWLASGWARQRTSGPGLGPRPRERPIKDAWTEAARRVEPPAVEELEEPDEDEEERA
jgi:hypothetical protein